MHDQLGFGAMIAGVTIALQYLATLLSRPLAGKVADTLGGKRAIRYGLLGIAGCGVLTLLSAWALNQPTLSLGLLLAGRLPGHSPRVDRRGDPELGNQPGRP